MDRSLLEKSFEIRNEEKLKKQNLFLFGISLCLASTFKFTDVCNLICAKFTSNERLMILYCDTVFKISVISCCYFFVMGILLKCMQTHISVTEKEGSLLGIKFGSDSIEICRGNESSLQKNSNNNHTSTSKSMNDSSVIKNDNLFKSFQGDYSQEFDNFLKNSSSYKSLNLNESQGDNVIKEQHNKNNYLLNLINKNFSFNFPFKNNSNNVLPSMACANYSDELYHINKEKKEDKKFYYQGYHDKKDYLREKIFANTKYKVIDIDLDKVEKHRLILKMRKWISDTILQKIIAEIRNINQYFRKNGFFEYLIGEASCSTLSWFIAKHSSIPELKNLKTLLLFLDISSNQRYVVSRVTELASDGSLSRYNHSGSVKGENYNLNADLPSDSKIIMHLFLAYMDTHYPKTINNDPKPFSRRFFVDDSLSNPLTESKSQPFLILCSKGYFSIIIKEKMIHCEQSNDNVFICLIYLIIYVKYQLKGYAGSLYFGASGVNLHKVIE